MIKRLYKSATDKMLFGVCGGVAEYFDIDPTIVRLAWALLAFACGGGIVAYVVAAIVIPDKPEYGQE